MQVSAQLHAPAVLPLCGTQSRSKGCEDTERYRIPIYVDSISREPGFNSRLGDRISHFGILEVFLSPFIQTAGLLTSAHAAQCSNRA
jgi:hypothetical protein